MTNEQKANRERIVSSINDLTDAKVDSHMWKNYIKLPYMGALISLTLMSSFLSSSQNWFSPWIFGIIFIESKGNKRFSPDAFATHQINKTITPPPPERT